MNDMLYDISIICLEVLICPGKNIFVFFEQSNEIFSFIGRTILSQVDILRCGACSQIHYLKLHG
jgi:hypothetical protein